MDMFGSSLLSVEEVSVLLLLLASANTVCMRLGWYKSPKVTCQSLVGCLYIGYLY